MNFAKVEKKGGGGGGDEYLGGSCMDKYGNHILSMFVVLLTSPYSSCIMLM